MAAQDRSFAPETVRSNTAADRAAGAPGAELNDRNAAGREAAGDLGASTPPGVDIHDLGQADHPEQDWGDESAEGAVFSSNHSRRGVRTEAERSQGAKTRQHNKDIFNRKA